MKGIRKPFSKSLHAKNDPRSREIVKMFFASQRIILIDHPNKYDIDLLTEDGKLRVEVERRVVWKEEKFPFPSIHVLERKKKFFEAGDTHYCIVSKNYDYLGFISSTTISKYMDSKYLIEIPNKFVKRGEYAYDIPIDKFEFYSVDL